LAAVFAVLKAGSFICVLDDPRSKTHYCAHLLVRVVPVIARDSGQRPLSALGDCRFALLDEHTYATF
jgi:hypothetical protein